MYYYQKILLSGREETEILDQICCPACRFDRPLVSEPPVRGPLKVLLETGSLYYPRIIVTCISGRNGNSQGRVGWSRVAAVFVSMCLKERECVICVL